MKVIYLPAMDNFEEVRQYENAGLAVDFYSPHFKVF